MDTGRANICEMATFGKLAIFSAIQVIQFLCLKCKRIYQSGWKITNKLQCKFHHFLAEKNTIHQSKEQISLLSLIFSKFYK